MYYFGGYDKGQNLRQYFKYFGLADRVKAERMDENGFDRISFMNADDEYKIAMGHDNFVVSLAKQFPSERGALKEYIKTIKETCEEFPLYNIKAGKPDMLKQKDMYVSARGFIDSVTKNQKLRAVLAGGNLLYAGIGETPLYVHALITDSFIQSAWKFRGGSGQVSELLVSSIRNAGGEVLTDSEVVSIKAHGGKVKDVCLKDFRIIEADNFIADIHPGLAVGMIEGSNSGGLFKERVMGLENTSSAFILYITLKKNATKNDGCNYFYSSDENVWDAADYGKGVWPEKLHDLISCAGS